MNKIIFALIAGIIIYVLVTKINNEENEKKNLVSNEIQQATEDSEDEYEEENDEINTEDASNFFNLNEVEDFDPNTEPDENENEKTLVYLDINCNGNVGRVIIELKVGIVPKTCNNFIELCEQKAYKNTKFHRVIKDFMIQGGDFTNGDGTGGVSIYGSSFNDENFKLKNKKGTIAMANSGPNTNGSQFFINVIDTPWLDNKHVVFGNIVKGIDLIEYISDQPTNENDFPINDIIIQDCGKL